MDSIRWKKCVDFHGHVCGGLAIGYRASLYAEKLLGVTYSSDEQIVCIAENDACGIDAVQVILGCSAGKGNLLFHLTGKQAFSFYNRKTGQSVRLVLKKKPEGMKREQAFEYYRTMDFEDLFEVKKTVLEIPETARIFQSFECESCGEIAAENYIRLQNGKKLCIDCYDEYKRFNV